MVKMHKLTKGGQTIYPATIYDAVANPKTRKSLTTEISELHAMNVIIDIQKSLNISYNTFGELIKSQELKSYLRNTYTDLSRYNVIMTFRNMQGVTETYQYKGYNIDVNYISDASYWERLDNSLMVESNAYSNMAEISLIGENKYIDFNTGEVKTSNSKNHAVYKTECSAGNIFIYRGTVLYSGSYHRAVYAFYKSSSDFNKNTLISIKEADENTPLYFERLEVPSEAKTLLVFCLNSESIKTKFMLTRESIKQERLLPGNRILISGNIISVDDQDLSTRQELSDLDKKKADISIEMVNPINWWNKNSKIGFYDANTGEFKENESYLSSEVITVSAGNIIQCGYFLSVSDGIGVNWVRYNPNQFITLWHSDGRVERINNTAFPSFPYQVEENCKIAYTWYKGNVDVNDFEMNKQYGVLMISDDTPTRYEEYFIPYEQKKLAPDIIVNGLDTSKFATKEDLDTKQNKLIVGNGISLSESGQISLTQEGSLSLMPNPTIYRLSYQIESRKSSDNYPSLPLIKDAKELLFVLNGKINPAALFLFGKHRIGIDQTSYIYSVDKTVTLSGQRGGILPLKFMFNGDAIELGHRGKTAISILINEGNGWMRLGEKAIDILTENGWRSYTQIKFASAIEREIIIENSSLVYSLRYSNSYTVSEVTLKQPLAVIAGSSITEATAGGEFAPMGWASICCWQLGMECINIGVGQRGLVTDTDSRPSISSAIDDITYFKDADYVLLGGAINDQYDDGYRNRVKTFVESLKKSMPSSHIILLGEYTPQPDSNISGNTHEKRNEALKSVARECSIPFIDMQNCEVYNHIRTIIRKDTQWISGTFLDSSSDAMSQEGNCDLIYHHENGSIDHTHPGRIGHQYIGTRMANAMLEILKYL